MRPGERLNEILFAHQEPLAEIGIAGIMAARPSEPPIALMREWTEALQDAVAGNDMATVRAVLAGIVPESALRQDLSARRNADRHAASLR